MEIFIKYTTSEKHVNSFVSHCIQVCKLNVMVHRCKCLCFTSQLWLPYPASCFDLTECFWGLCIWSGIVGSKSGKLRHMLRIMTETTDTQQQKKGEFLIESNLDNVHTNSLARI